MGKGDKKSKRGKVAMGTFGKSRPRASKLKPKAPVAKKAKK